MARYLKLYRSSHHRCSVKKVFLEISQKSQENTCSRVSFLIKLKAYATLLKERLCHRCFPVNFVEFLRIPFSQNRSGRLLFKFLSDIYAHNFSDDYVHSFNFEFNKLTFLKSRFNNFIQNVNEAETFKNYIQDDNYW